MSSERMGAQEEGHESNNLSVPCHRGKPLQSCHQPIQRCERELSVPCHRGKPLQSKDTSVKRSVRATFSPLPSGQASAIASVFRLASSLSETFSPLPSGQASAIRTRQTGPAGACHLSVPCHRGKPLQSIEVATARLVLPFFQSPAIGASLCNVSTDLDSAVATILSVPCHRGKPLQSPF